MGYCMRVFGRKHLCTISALQGVLLALLSAAVPNAVHGQTAPYVLPYTMSTYAGGNAQYTVGATCAGGTGVALDTAGDGCLALQGSINGEPHDVRVDPRGYVYFIDNTGTTSGVVHRINPFTQLLTIYVGNLVGNKVCTPNQTKYGDGCPANDGVANDNPATLTTIALKAVRGLGISTNGNLLIAGYNDYYDHVVLASNGYMSLLAGTGVSGSTNGPVGTSSVDQSRGIGSDPTSSIVYVADTANNLLRQIYSGTTSTLTATNTGNVKNVVSGTSASSEQLYGPEDAQTDSYGNIYISDQSDGVVMAIYKAGTLPGISKPTVGNAYLIAGYFSASAAVNPYTYPSPPYVNNIGPAEPATTVSIGSPRKLSIDKYNNLYIADSTGNVVWFVDAATGYIRALVGDYGATAGNPPVGCSGQLDTYGDGCPGTLASLYPSSDLGDSIDNAGNLYITDAEGGSNVNARIRKLLSGLNFPATPAGSSATQNIDLHFGVGDTPAATNGYMLTAKGSDFTTGSAACAINNDSTTDCILPITFTPTQAGYDSAMLTVTSAMGGVTTYEVTGAGTAAAIAFDPGVTSTLSPSIKNAQGIALDGAGDAYIADTGNNRVLFYSATTGATTVFAGGGTACGSATDSFGDGCPAGSSTLNAPSAVAIDVFGNVFIADTGNNIIREVSPSTGLITLYAGGAAASSSGSACAGQTASAANPVALAFDTYGDGCPALLANFSRPSGLATDTLGSLYVADSGHNVIRVIASNSFVSAFAGGASAVCATTTDAVGDGCGSSAVTFSNPTGLAYDSINKALLVADTGNSDVRRISLGTTYTVSSNIATNILIQPVTLIVGSGHAGDSLSPTGAAIGSDLSAPTGVAVDPAGDVYIADTGNDSIRLVNATGGISTIAGINTVSGTGSIGGVTASISALQITSNTVTFTAANSFTSGENVLISGLSSSAGQSIDGQMLTVLANGLSSTQFSAVVSAANAPLTADSGTATVASSSATQTELTNPGDLAILPNGTLLVLDSGNNRVFSDVRSQISYNFGRVNVGAPSPAFNLTELNIGVSSASLPAFVESPSNPQFTLTGTTNGTGNVPACGAGPLAPGTLCNLQAQFTPTAVTTGNVSASFTQSPSPALPTGAPTVTLLGTGAVLTTTTSVVMQTSPVPPAQPQYGANLTVGAPLYVQHRSAKLLSHRKHQLRCGRRLSRQCRGHCGCQQRDGFSGHLGTGCRAAYRQLQLSRRRLLRRQQLRPDHHHRCTIGHECIADRDE
jgi:sugar lactone lactonase YvrE